MLNSTIVSDLHLWELSLEGNGVEKVSKLGILKRKIFQFNVLREKYMKSKSVCTAKINNTYK